MRRRWPVLLGVLVALASAAAIAGPVFDDPAPDICGTWKYGFVVAAWFAVVPALIVALASLKWRSLRAFALAIVVGAVVGSCVGAVVAQLELRDLQDDPSGHFCD